MQSVKEVFGRVFGRGDSKWSARYVPEEHSWRVHDGYNEICMAWGAENARLIAAAPDMLDTLNKLHAMYSDMSRTHFDLVEIRNLLASAIERKPKVNLLKTACGRNR